MSVRTTRSSTHSHFYQFHHLLHELYLTNHHSSQEHAIYGTSCLLLPFLNLTTCHHSSLSSIIHNFPCVYQWNCWKFTQWDQTFFRRYFTSFRCWKLNDLNRDLEKVRLWVWQWKIEFSTDKTEEVIFSSKRTRQQHPVLMLGPDEATNKSEHKHLGRSLAPNWAFKIMSKKLSWKLGEVLLW